MTRSRVVVSISTGELLEQASWSSPPDQSLSIYLALVTSSRFYSLHSRYPGSLTAQQGDVDGTKDVDEMVKIGQTLLKELAHDGGDDLPGPFDKAIKELYATPPPLVLCHRA